jgi:hypothetical protein
MWCRGCLALTDRRTREGGGWRWESLRKSCGRDRQSQKPRPTVAATALVCIGFRPALPCLALLSIASSVRSGKKGLKLPVPKLLGPTTPTPLAHPLFFLPFFVCGAVCGRPVPAGGKYIYAPILNRAAVLLLLLCCIATLTRLGRTPFTQQHTATLRRHRLAAHRLQPGRHRKGQPRTAQHSAA